MANNDLTQQMISHINRRRLLGMLGSTAMVSAAGDLGAQSDNRNLAASVSVPFCVVKPEQTEGPYFMDEKLQRSDLRLDSADNSIRPGLPLRLVLRLSSIADNACSPLAGAVLDVWHNDAHGEYSGVRDRKYDNRGKQFLRGYQLTDANGEASFLTIYPGWYPGRTVHIHFKVRTNPEHENGGEEFTSQLYFDDEITDAVHVGLHYAANGSRSTRNKDDRIYRNGGEQLMLRLVADGEGYTADFELGLVRS